MYRKNTTILSLLLVMALTIAGFGSVFADDGDTLFPETPAPTAETGEMTNETPALWFVELSSAPAVTGTNPASLRAEQNAFRNNARQSGLVYTERFAFSTLWNGLSIQVDSSQIAKLSRISGVKAIYPVDIVRIPETATADPEMATALAMTGADVAQSELGYTGTGIKVAVMDTGIDYDHPDLGGCFGPGCRVAFGYDFVGDDFNADPNSPFYNPVPVPDPDPDDCQGHGTHVAGIVGANGEVVGVAPGVTFGAYRVFGCDGSTTADIMLAAMEAALADGMDVLNMSIGSAFQWPQYPTAQASNYLVNNGMVVVASIGNNGPSGLYAASAPGLGEKVIGVASFDNSHISALTFNVNPGGQQVPYLPLSTTPDPPTSGDSAEVVFVGRGCLTPFDPYLDDPAGKVALIVRGDCTFQEKYQRAADAGAVGVVIHNNATGLFSGGGVTSRDIFGVGISLADGLHIRSLLDNSETVTLTWTDVRINAANPTGGLISSFSSYGLAPDLNLKPDIGAPGGLIRSTYPLEKGAYFINSGTSMSSPHVAGAAALLLEARPNTPAQAVRGILQNSADPKNWWGNPGLGFLDNVHRQGAGMLDIDDAILSTTTISPSKIATGESESGPYSQTLTIQNKGASAVTYDLSFVNALSTGANTFTVGFNLSNASVAFSAASVTVPAGGSASVDATINPATGPVGGQYGGYIVFTPQGGGQVYRVPFAGYIGDYQAKQVLTSGGFGFPALGWTPNGVNFGFAGAGDTFTMQGFDVPYFLVHFDHQPRLFRVEIFDQDDKAWHRAYNEDYMPRNSTSTGFFAFPFDGTTFVGNKTYTVPDGTYYAVISVLKANGDSGNPAHWETWTSPHFIVDRP
jgi:minor extracellular serine protease Vpr